MLFVLIVLLLIIAVSTKTALPGAFYKDYLSKENTLSIKGLFVVLVFFQHFNQYVNLSGVYDRPLISLLLHLHQMLVAMFLFYSGFGIMESIRNKGFAYVKTVPTKRFLTLFINFAIAVTLFLIMKTAFGISYPFEKIILSYIGWDSLGNSNWYIFATLCMYLLVFASFFVVKWLNNNGGRLIGCVVLTILTMAYVYLHMVIGRQAYTYNTVILFVLGCWYSLFKPQIESLVMKNDYVYSFVCAANLLVYLWFYYKRFESIWSYSVWGVCFVLMIVLFTMKFSIKSTVLNWLGSHVFSIYILQRIPMILLQYFGYADKKYMFFVASLITTVFIALVYDYFTGKLFNVIWKKRINNKKNQVF